MDVWESIYYIFSLRGEYFRIQYRNYYRSIQRQKILRRFFICLVLLLLLIAVVTIMVAGYSHSWTGFSSYHDSTGIFYPAKKLWDWMELLLIPALLATLAFFFSRAQSHREIALGLLNKREQALQDYFSYMTQLLVNTDCQNEDNVESAQRLARVRTITLLEMLEGRQKGYVVMFLVEAGLVDRDSPLINLERANLQSLELEPGDYSMCNFHGVNLYGANLAWCNLTHSDLGGSTIQRADLESIDLSSSNLDYTDLSGADLYESRFIKAHMIKTRFNDANLEKSNLREAILRTAEMKGANLRRANLAGAYLQFADLRFANLQETDLSNADLKYANFYGAKLRGANLSGADLSNTDITKGQLRSAKSTENAILPVNVQR